MSKVKDSIIVSTGLPKSMKEDLEALSKETLASVSYHIRKAVQEYLERNNSKKIG